MYCVSNQFFKIIICFLLFLSTTGTFFLEKNYQKKLKFTRIVILTLINFKYIMKTNEILEHIGIWKFFKY